MAQQRAGTFRMHRTPTTPRNVHPLSPLAGAMRSARAHSYSIDYWIGQLTSGTCKSHKLGGAALTLRRSNSEQLNLIEKLAALVEELGGYVAREERKEILSRYFPSGSPLRSAEVQPLRAPRPSQDWQASQEDQESEPA